VGRKAIERGSDEDAKKGGRGTRRKDAPDKGRKCFFKERRGGGELLVEGGGRGI